MRAFLTATACILLSTSCVVGESLLPSAKIDQLVKDALKKQGIEPNPGITDETFLRRAYLNIIGRVPTIEESEAFHTDSYPNKREKLIEKLINSEGYVSHAYHFWADLLRLNGRPGTAIGHAYELWVKEALRNNMPYDEMVYSLVTAEGKFWENGAVGYYFRDRGMPLDNMSNTVRVFLGTRLECAQCHNHPFDKWTQMDYFKMASFSYGMNTRNYDSPNRDMLGRYQKELAMEAYKEKAGKMTGLDDFPVLNTKSLERYIEITPEKAPKPEEVMKEYVDKKTGKTRQRKILRKSKPTRHELLGLTKDKFVKVARASIAASEKITGSRQASRELLGELYNPLQYLSVSETDKNAKLPHDYQYSDANPHDVIPAATMFGDEINLEASDSKIESYGKWMTSKTNPTFTRVIVNRLWKEVFGHGIFEPVDELTDHTFFSNPELLAYLEKLMIELEYDQKAFLQVLYNTNTYQQTAYTKELPMGTPYYFQGPVLRRMSAEQIWDSLVALALPEADNYQPRLKIMVTSIDRVKQIYKSLEERPFEEYVAMIDELSPLVGKRRKIDEENRAKLYKLQQSGDEEGYRALRRELAYSKKELNRKISDVAYIHLNKKVEADDLLLAMGVMDVGMQMMDDSDAATDDATRAIMTKLPKMKSSQPPAELTANGKKNRTALKAWQQKQKTEQNVYRNLISGMARASEIQSPARRGHFLRDFGQSDREVIENASNHASVPQALNLLNGPIVQSLTNRYSVFGSRLHEAGTPDEKTRMIFQAMLTRNPSEEELQLVRSEVERDGEEAYQGIVWALLNTQQFMFIQ